MAVVLVMERHPSPVRGHERRANPRLSIALEVDFRSGHNFYSARTRDISVGGLFIETDLALPIGSRLEVDLRFLKEHLKLPCEVVWALEGEAGPVGFGVRFLELPARAKKQIEAFMVLRTPLAFGDDLEEPAMERPQSVTAPASS